MPILDTEFIMALGSADKKHQDVLRTLEKIKEGEIENVVVTDTAIWEVYTVLRNRGRVDEIRHIFRRLNEVCEEYEIEVMNLFSKELILRHISIEKGHDLNFFDSLLAASAENHDHSIVSSDKVYDRLGLKRISLGGEKL
jgi:predicted nucleic acid-binding protein